MGNAVSLIVDAVAIVAAIPSGGASLTLLEGMAIAGAAVNAIGTVTNNKTLQTIGAVAGVGAGIGAMASPELFNSSISSLASGTGDAQQAANFSAAIDAAPTTSVAALGEGAPVTPALADVGTAGAQVADAAPAAAGAASATAPDVATQVATGDVPAPTASDLALPQSTTDAAQNTLSRVPGAPAVDAQKGWLASMLGNNGDRTNAELLKIGAGTVGGIASYLAPTPAEKAAIALQNQQNAALQQQQGILAARNTVAKPTGLSTPGAAAPNSAYGAPATGYGPTVGNAGAAMGYAPQVAAPGQAMGYGPQVATPGIMANAMQPTQTNAQGLTLNSQGNIV